MADQDFRATATTGEGARPKGSRIGRLSRRLMSRAAAMGHDYGRDESGNILIMTAFLAIPIVTAIAVALDTAELYRAERNFQQAADAAVLVAANMYSDGASEDDARAAGERIFADNLGNLPDSRGTPTFDFPADCGTGNITVAVNGEHPLFFPFIHGVGKSESELGGQISIDAAASCPTSTFEVALVLDTSGSMGWTIPGDPDTRPKIEIMQEAARGLASDIFALKPQIPRPDAVRFSVVPFSGMVAVDYRNSSSNVGDPKEAWQPSYEDKNGISPIHHRDFDWSWDTARQPTQNGNGWTNGVTGDPLTRYTLYDDLGVTWRGCMQARPYPHSVQDTEPTAGTAASLFVPSFAPDEPDNLNGVYNTYEDDPHGRPWCVQWRNANQWGVRRCRVWSDGLRNQRNSRGFPRRPVRNDGTYYINGEYQFQGVRDTNNAIAGELYFNNNYIADRTNMPRDNECKGHVNHDKCSGLLDQPKRQAFTFKYKNPNWHSSSSVEGPNYSCRSAPLLPLKPELSDVTTYIDQLQASGSTNVPAGAAWGWRTLSSRKPFEGRRETQLDNHKIMVLMTDGQNTYYNPKQFYPWYQRDLVSDINETVYGGYGYGKNDDGVNKPTDGDGFMFDGFGKYPNPGQNPNTWTEAMDAHLVEVCTNAKEGQVIIYSIAFDVANGSSIKQVLEGCASDRPGGGKYYYDARDSSKLAAAFKEIADSLKRLRLVK